MKLKHIAIINAGYPFRGKISEVVGSNLVAVQMKDVSLSEGILWSECIETELTGKREPDYLAAGDIIVASRGSHNYAALVGQKLAMTGKYAVASPHFFVIRLTNEDILPEFIVWFLNQEPAQRYFEKNSEGSVTKSIRRSVLEEVSVVAPTLAKQRAIIALAKTLRDEQRLIQKLVNNGERMMNAIARELFENKEVD